MARKLIQKRRAASEEPQINLTPLIDVVFCILIMFIVIAPLLELDKVELAEASPSHQHELTNASEDDLTIYVKEDNSIWLGNKRVTLEQLTFILKEERARKRQNTPKLFHDRRAHFGTYQAIKNALETAGFESVDVILKPA